MSFSILPVELKARIAYLAAQADRDPAQHRFNSYRGQAVPPDYRQSALSLAGVSKQMREMALPYAVEVRC